MSRFSCRCGNQLTNTTCPSTHEGQLVTDLEQDDFELATTDNGHRVSFVDPFKSREFMECPKCFRIWIQLAHDNPRYVPYLPEEEPLKLAEQQGGYRG